MTGTFSARRPLAPGALGRMSRNPSSAWRHVDVVLVGCVAAVSALGCLMIFSATRGRNPSDYDTSFLFKQLLFMAVGVGVMALVAAIDYRRYRELVPIAYGGAVLLLLLVVSGLGSTKKGTQAWFPMGPFQLQPSEVAKIVVIVAMASVIAQFESDLDLGRLVALLGVVGIPMGLILLQPDLGTALVFVAVSMGVLLVGGAQVRHILAITVLGLAGTFFVLHTGMLESYQQCRLTSFIDSGNSDCEGAAYNVTQAQTAIGSGGLAGKGPFKGTQTRLDLVPEQHTDFIFTAVGEELGFLGSATLLALLAAICWRIWRTAQMARDPLGTLICVGVLSMFVFQIFENVGMTMGIMPVTGIPLPFMSYGGSSTLTEFLAVGLVLNIHMRRFS